MTYKAACPWCDHISQTTQKKYGLRLYACDNCYRNFFVAPVSNNWSIGRLMYSFDVADKYLV